jgi:hypothetical protein
MIEDKRITVEKERTRRVDRPNVLSGDLDPRVVLERVGRGSAALKDVGALIIERCRWCPLCSTCAKRYGFDASSGAFGGNVTELSQLRNLHHGASFASPTKPRRKQDQSRSRFGLVKARELSTRQGEVVYTDQKKRRKEKRQPVVSFLATNLDSSTPTRTGSQKPRQTRCRRSKDLVLLHRRQTRPRTACSHLTSSSSTEGTIRPGLPRMAALSAA